jgi:hypothetical protein
MDKNILTVGICIFIFYMVYLKINQNISNHETIKYENHQEPLEHDESNDLEEFKNIDKEIFDPYTFYKKSDKQPLITKITKDNFDIDYEPGFNYNIEFDKYDNSHYNREHYGSDENLVSQGRPIKLSEENKTNLFKEGSLLLDHERSSKSSDLLVPNDLEPNFIYSMPFPENTSIELAQFTAENVTDLYDANSMEELYNNLNADAYQGYKSLKYML